MEPTHQFPLEDFLKTTKPARSLRESRLLPFAQQIEEARSLGYTLAQICDWLSKNGVGISIQGLSKFLIRRTPAQSKPHRGAATTAVQPLRDLPKGLDARSADRKRRENTADEFIKEDRNSVLTLLKDSNK